MAVTTQILQDGPRNCVMKFTNDGDVESAVLKVDVSTLSADPSLGPCTGVRIVAIRYQLIGMNVQILWDADTDVPAIFLVPQAGDCVKMYHFGGLYNNAGAGKTGDVLFSTDGTPATDACYTIILEMVKTYGHGVA